MPVSTLGAPRGLLPAGGRATVLEGRKNITHVLFAGRPRGTITPVDKAQMEVRIPEWEGQVGVIFMVLSLPIKRYANRNCSNIRRQRNSSHPNLWLPGWP